MSETHEPSPRDENIIDLTQFRAEAEQAVDVHKRLALTVQALYERRGLSLADPKAAAGNEAAFEAALLFVRGALAKGLIDQAGFEALEGLMVAAQTAPRHL